MKVHVISHGKEWEDTFEIETLKSILDAGSEAGIEYECFTHLFPPTDGINNGDGYIFFNMDPIYAPFVRINSKESSDSIVEKVQELADYMFGDVEFTGSIIEELDNSEAERMQDIKKLVDTANEQRMLIPLEELGFNIGKEETVELPFNSLVIDVEGKDITVSKDAIVTLAKVQNLMREYGYSIKQVVV